MITHDYFDIRGGGERLVLTMAQALGADLLCGFRSAQSYPPSMFPDHTVELGLPGLLRRPGLRTAALAARFATSKRRVVPYNTRIFSGVSAPFAAVRTNGAKNIYYCHTPPRFLYDQRAHFSANVLKRRLGGLTLEHFQRSYEAAVSRMDLIVVNSATVAERVEKFLGRQSVIVHPPCDLKAFQWLGQSDYYLSTARHSALKRVDAIIRAFAQMPEKRLVIASGGEDTKNLQQLAAGAQNISFTGWTSDRQLQELIGNAIATIYLPVDEDFGMSAVESMSAGKPVIGVAEGGLRETILHGQTGVLLPSDFKTEDLMNSVRALTPVRAKDMRSACVARAEHFSEERFVKGMLSVLQSLS